MHDHFFLASGKRPWSYDSKDEKDSDITLQKGHEQTNLETRQSLFCTNFFFVETINKPLITIETTERVVKLSCMFIFFLCQAEENGPVIQEMKKILT